LLTIQKLLRYSLREITMRFAQFLEFLAKYARLMQATFAKPKDGHKPITLNRGGPVLFFFIYRSKLETSLRSSESLRATEKNLRFSDENISGVDMAYGKRAPYTKRSGNSRRYSRGVRDRAARRVQRVYKRKRVARPSKTIISNVKAIARLEQRVKGQIQKNFHVATFDPDFAFKPEFPMCFALNDFTAYDVALNPVGGQIHQPQYSGVPPNIDLAIQTAGNWTRRYPGANLGLDPKYHQWAVQNAENVINNQSYTPVYAEYSFTFKRDVQSTQTSNIWIRMDEITPRRMFNCDSQYDVEMPHCLGAFQQMADNCEPKTQNMFNPQLWKVKTRWLKLSALENNQTMP